jgi:SWI/SNF-related matrix-associated actin-dependent regulator 1 of chromatin subfamily A
METTPKVLQKMKRAVKKHAVMIRYKSGEFGIKVTTQSTTDTSRVRRLPGRKRDPKGRFWTLPLDPQTVDKLRRWGWDLHPALIAYLQKNRESVNDLSRSSLVIPGLGMELFNFQKKGVEFVETKNGNALIADEMGLGKTAQSLAWCQLHPRKRPVVIVCPACVKLNWGREADMWMKHPRVIILSGRTGEEIPGEPDLVIVNYDILANETEEYEKITKGRNGEPDLVEIKTRELPYTGWIDFIRDLIPKVVIGDEIHFVKNSKAKRTKAFRKLVKPVRHKIFLSGTPITNRPVEFYNGIQMLAPQLFSNWWYYVHRYCDAKHSGFGLDTSGASNEEELHEKLINSIMIRRLKAEVMKDLPPKLYSFLPMELTNRGEYREAEKNFIEFIQRQKGAEAAERASNAQTVAQIETLKQLAVEGKMEAMLEWIQDVLENGEKLIVFAVHRFVIDRLMKEFGNCAVKVDGSVTGGKRQLAVDKFQNEPEKQLFVGQIEAAGVGITLTAAHHLAFIEYPWTPGVMSQATDRPHRIGQDKPVNIYYLLAEGTIEEEIAKMLDEKKTVLDAVLDGKAPEKGSLLMELIKNYTDEKQTY